MRKQHQMAGYKIQNQNGLYYLTLTIIDWVDVFTRPVYRDIIIDSLDFCQKEKGLVVHAFTIMSNHIHLICRAKEGSIGLSRIIADFKKFTANQILKTIQTENESRRDWMLLVFSYNAKTKANNRHHQVWIQDNHPIALITPKWIKQKINYIHLNAVRAKWVKEAHHYPYSSASNYRDGSGLLDVEIIDLGVTDFYVFTGR